MGIKNLKGWISIRALLLHIEASLLYWAWAELQFIQYYRATDIKIPQYYQVVGISCRLIIIHVIFTLNGLFGKSDSVAAQWVVK